jgi:arylsulfatase A-like enzyme
MKLINLLLLLLLVVNSPVAAQTTQPNIIVIITDDAGYDDWGFNGSSLIETPNIDNLVNQGTKFSQGYVTNSVCSPSRAGLITGRYQNRFGYEYNLVNYYPAPGYQDDDDGLDLNELTIADHLKPLGYATSAIGKWHLGQDDHFHPLNRGFDYFYGLLKGSRPYFHTDDLEDGKKLMRNWEIDDLTSGYVTNVLTDEAINWMQTQVDANQPFFSYLSYTAVHAPYEAQQDDLDYFDNCNCSDDRQALAAMTYNLDSNVGRLVDFLEDKGVFDNTLIIFVNDNGGPNKNGRHLNTPFRGFKSSFYEGGLRVPMTLTWPAGQVPANNTYDKQVITLDILPTVLAAAGGQLPTDREIDGVDLVPFLNSSGDTPHEYLFWRKMWTWSVVKKGNQKLVINYNQLGDMDNDTLLFDLSIDINENSNIIANNQETKQEFLGAFAEWEEEMVLPHWIGDNFFNNLCGESGAQDPMDCPFLLVEYGFLTAQEYEAEDGVLSGTARVSNCASASNGQHVKKLNGSSSNSVTFDVNVAATGDYALTVSYMTTTARVMNIEVNGVLQILNVAPTGLWCFQGGIPGNHTSTVSLNEGENTIKFFNSPLLDKIEITPLTGGIYEAEEATLSGTAFVSDCATMSNGQHVKKLNGPSSNSATFDVNVSAMGNYELTVSYLTTNARTMNVEINGVQQILNVPSTGLWCFQGGTPGDHTITVSLNGGQNTIKFFNAPLLDKIEISPLSSPSSLPIELTTFSKPDIVAGVARGQNGIEIFPNPTSGQISVIGIDNGNYRIYDLQGKMLIEEVFNGGEINISDLAKGVYLLQFNSIEKLTTMRIIKN